MVNVLKIVLIGLSLSVIFGECRKRKAKSPQASTMAPITNKASVKKGSSKADPKQGDKVKVVPPTVTTASTTTTEMATETTPLADTTTVVMTSTEMEPLPELIDRSRYLPLVYLEVLDAKIGTDFDWLSETDCYVAVEVKNSDGFAYEAGKTRVAVDMINPEFYQVFKLDKLKTDSIITFKLYDNDYLYDQSIGEVSIEIEKVLRTDQNYREIKLTFNDEHDYVAIRVMIIASLVDYSDTRKRNEVAKDALLTTCCKWAEFKKYVRKINGEGKDSKETKTDFEYIVNFSSSFEEILMRQICTEKYFHESFCSRLNSTDRIPIYDQMLSTLLINL